VLSWVSLADVLGTIAKNPLLLKKESDGKVSFTLATATIDKEAKRSTKTTVQLSNIDLLSDWLAGLLLAWLVGLLLGWLAGLLSDWLAGLLSACLSFECLSFECLSFAVKSRGQSCRCARHYCQKPTTTQKRK
jgi:hypothetical protein